MSQLLKRFFYTLPLVFIGCLGSMPGHAVESSVVSIAAGYDHTCALTTAGGVKCWGNNESGQLGNNSTTNSLKPVDVVGLASGVVAIAAGYRHTCALTTAGGVKCWGELYEPLHYNGVKHLTPVDMPDLTSGAVAIVTGGAYTCALTTTGGVKCWGVYSPLLATTPEVYVKDINSGMTAITAGFFHTCGLTTAGGVKCWGVNHDGQLGDNSSTEHLTPVDVTGLPSGAAAITAGWAHTCALTTAGGVKCWGDNFYGQLGDNSRTNSLKPVDVSGLASGVAAIAAGDEYTCALTTAGGVKCWGAKLVTIKGGPGSTNYSESFDEKDLTPVNVNGLSSGVAALAAGRKHACVLTTAGGVKCWGLNDFGQLGDNTNTNRLAPMDVIGLSGGVTSGPVAAPASPLTGLWWNQNESGWGMSITQRDSMAFLAWYTYDSIGKPTWFVISSCPLVGSGCTGDLYSVVGGTPLGVPWNGSGKVVTKVGTGSVAFSDNNTGTLNYSVNGVNGTKQITRQMFATGSVQPSVNYSALWWNENESGWGLAITQQYGMIFATMYTYDASGNPVWYVASSCPLSGNSCAGDLYQVTGGSAPTVTWNDAAKVVTKVGTVNFTFQNSSAGTLTYTINGVSGSKVISRQLF
ncbi:RCC1 domain-containing protein [Candidatus Nitrotoga arctica]|uniref:Alpha-tubulin suppressor n=1 Tax=Candidatus Nitrotoga arctica TaxID=453162 RepID=A0ABM8YWW9_9PROT|nr:hypothetical protein [Candidatus Nitrotoga arctica]CAG9931999.1 conserved exported protein of unknown function [Candidatus Nitrotoga arctica]